MDDFEQVFCPRCNKFVEPDVEPEQQEECGPWRVPCPECGDEITIESDEIADDLGK